MTHIKLVENSGDIEHQLFRELFISKLQSLHKVLNYFERYKIDATITFAGVIKEKRLHTDICVHCDDDVFKKVIEANVNKFKTPVDLIK